MVLKHIKSLLDALQFSHQLTRWRLESFFLHRIMLFGFHWFNATSPDTHRHTDRCSY